MSGVIDVHIRRVSDDKYSVKLSFDTFTNGLGEMTRMELYSYLKNRPLLDVTPERMIDSLRVGHQTTVHFQRVL